MTPDVLSNDLTIDLAEARSKLASAGRRTTELFASISDPRLPVPPLAWDVGEVGAHVAVVLRGYSEAANGDHVPVESLIPAGATFAERLSAVNAGTLALEPARDPKALSELIGQRVEEFLAATAPRSGAERIATPFYGEGASLSLATSTAMLVGEQLVHGYDVAAAAGRPWPIAASDAKLVLRALISMMPLAANPVTTAGVHARYKMSIRGGGPRIVVSVDDGKVSVEAAQPGRVDCHLSAEAVTLLLVVYGRIGQWGPIARGKLSAWGRKPWLGFTFTNLFFNP